MKKKMMVLTGLLMAVVVTAYSVSGTYAKYISEFTGSSSATVAKWAFSINGKNATATEDFTFNLFDTILDTTETTDPDGKELDVIAGKIAPGTKGEFDIALVNNSEVSAKITMTADVEYTPVTVDGQVVTYTIPLEYSLDGTHWNSDLEAVLDTVEHNLAFTGTTLPGSTTVTDKIQWRWAFGDVTDLKDDEFDTNLGILAANGDVAPEITVTLHITAEQID